MNGLRRWYEKFYLLEYTNEWVSEWGSKLINNFCMSYTITHNSWTEATEVKG